MLWNTATRLSFYMRLRTARPIKVTACKVASLAGVPRSVIDKAKTKLRHLEDHAYSEQQRPQQALTNWICFSSKECHPVVTLLEDTKRTT